MVEPGLHGRQVAVYAQDFTIFGGSLGEVAGDGARVGSIAAVAAVAASSRGPTSAEKRTASSPASIASASIVRSAARSATNASACA